jgi:type VI secretion system secreted protein VgrG
MERLEIASAAALPPELLVLTRVRLVEELGRPYEAELDIVVDEDGGLSTDMIDELLRNPLLVRFGDEAEVHGILSSIVMLSTSQPRPIVYRARLVPKIWELSRIHRSRVFQDGSVVDHVNAVLAEIGFTERDGNVEWRVAKSYPRSEYTVQYQETDLDFVHRLLEHHGIYYFFDQAPEGERVVLTDDHRTLTPLDAPIVYDARSQNAENTGVSELTREIVPQPAMVLMREYNWRTPLIALQAQAPGDQATGRGLAYTYAEHWKDPGEGAALAQTRAEGLMCRREVFRGVCRRFAARPGRSLELTGHPLGDLDQAYTIVSVEILAERSDAAGAAVIVAHNHFTAIPARVPFRPDRRTPKPRIHGIMHARIDGAVPGSAAPIDEWGRYKVFFPFDLNAKPGGSASRWVRMAQPASGPGFGIHFPLHIGAEVAIAHLDGDPDRPVIMNSPPNTETVTPVNRQNATQNQIRTKAGIQMIWDDDC